MGDAYFNLGRFADSEQSYLKALDFGEDMFPTAGLVCLYSDQKDWQNAAHFFGLLTTEESGLSSRIEMLVKRFSHSGQQQSMLELFRYLLSAGHSHQRVLDAIENQIKLLS
ncbi:MAG: hypothetical protein J7K09_05285 [Desulfuromusa sp.]|nr:hypothetical protein [Desulfuromusa sp.]